MVWLRKLSVPSKDTIFDSNIMIKSKNLMPKVENMKSRMEILEEFADYTSGHGFASIHRTRELIGFYLWIGAMAIFWGLMIFQVTDAFTKFFKYSTTVTLRIEHSSEAHFPALSICNLNPLRDTQLRKIEKAANFVHKMENKAFGHADWNLIKHAEELTEEELMKAELSWMIYTFHDLNVTQLGHQLEHMLIDCVYQGRQCSLTNFTEWHHSFYGNCFTLFIPHNTFPSFLGPHYGLSLTLFTQEHEYLPSISSESGFIMQINRLPLPYDRRDCGNMLHHDPHKIKYQHKWEHVLEQSKSTIKHANFTNSACNKGCFLETLIDQCGCVDANIITYEHMTRSLGHAPRACDMANITDLNCVKETTLRINKEHTCERCLQACTEKMYVEKVTAGYWPREEYLRHVHDHWKERMPDSGLTNLTIHQLAQQTAKINIYFEELNFESIVESPAMDFWDLASVVGGTLGLYGGLSFLTMLEFCELFWRLLRNKKTTCVAESAAIVPATHKIHIDSHMVNFANTLY